MLLAYRLLDHAVAAPATSGLDARQFLRLGAMHHVAGAVRQLPWRRSARRAGGNLGGGDAPECRRELAGFGVLPEERRHLVGDVPDEKDALVAGHGEP